MPILINKPEGVSPIDYWKEYRKEKYGETSIVKGSVCGKLDPMASGQLLVLIEDECKLSPQYNKSRKIYQFGVVLGMSTDTDDILGLIEENGVDLMISNDDRINVEKAFLELSGKEFVQKFHQFSAIQVWGRTHEGKRIKEALWYFTTNGLLHTIEKVPAKSVNIENIHKLDTGEYHDNSNVEYNNNSRNYDGISVSDYLDRVIDRLNNVRIDRERFRVDTIIQKWKSLEEKDNIKLHQLDFQIQCSSGTYIRQIVRDISTSLNIRMHVTFIHRLAILPSVVV